MVGSCFNVMVYFVMFFLGEQGYDMMVLFKLIIFIVFKVD